jgi:hypothetical protein
MATLKLNDQQWAALEDADERNFVGTVRNDVVGMHPELANDPDLLRRLNAAFDETKRLGFIHDQSIVQFLYLEVDVPGFYRQYAISRWLSQAGKPAEERFGMLMDVLRAKMRDKQEKQ